MGPQCWDRVWGVTVSVFLVGIYIYVVVSPLLIANLSDRERYKGMITRAEEEEEILSKFLADMPTKLSWQSPTSTSCLWVFWSQEEEVASHLTSSSSTSSVLAIQNHIKTALCSFNVVLGFDDVLVQFWAPTMIGGVHLLTT